MRSTQDRRRTHLARALVEARSYRDFLQAAFNLNNAPRRNQSYALFAKRAGFASKGFLGDVIHGRKRITARSLPKFIRGLSLSGDETQLFTLLVQQTETDLCDVEPARLEKDLSRLRSKVLARLEAFAQDPRQRFYRIRDWPLVYAALGDQTTGATVADVMNRTGITSAERCSRILDSMHKVGVVEEIPERRAFVLRNPHLVFQEGDERSAIREFFLATNEKACQAASANFSEQSSLYFASAVSVRRDDLPRMKAELRELLVRYIDRNEQSDGDVVALFCCSMLPCVPAPEEPSSPAER